MTREERVEQLAQFLYESDPESEYQEGENRVEWRYNFAHQDRYRKLADDALAYAERHLSAQEEPRQDETPEQSVARYDRMLDNNLGGDVDVAIKRDGSATVILTRLRRMELVNFLENLTDEVAKPLGTDQDQPTDLHHIRMIDLPNGETMTSAILRVEN